MSAQPMNSRPAVVSDSIHPFARIGLYALLAVVGLLALAPLYWLLSSSITPSGEIFQFQWFPVHLEFNNYTEAWESAPFGRFYINSVVVTLAGALLQICVAVLSSYAFAYPAVSGEEPGVPGVPWRDDGSWRGRAAAQLPDHRQPGLGQHLCGSGRPRCRAACSRMFLLRQHMMTLPGEVIEAAKVDGAGHLRILWSIVLPMSRPMVVTVVIIALVEKWNDFIWPLVVDQHRRYAYPAGRPADAQERRGVHQLGRGDGGDRASSSSRRSSSSSSHSGRSSPASPRAR